MDDIVWESFTEQPFLLKDWETFTFILAELGKGKPYTPEMMKSLKDPRLKQRLLEAICLSKAQGSS